MSEFVGDDRKALRAQILDRLNEIALDESLEGPRIILLEGLSGVGKSRIIREVYEALRANRLAEHPQYWPSLDSIDDRKHVIQSATVGSRKVLGPPVQGFTWAEDALPTFLWWSLNCEQLSNGEYAQASAQLEEAMRWHSAAILMGWREVAPVSEQAKAELLRAARGIRDVLLGDKWDATMNASDIIDRLSNLDVFVSAIPGVGVVVKVLRGLFDRLVEERHLDSSLAQRITYGEALEDRAQAASALASRIRDVALPQLPVVVAVEDAHRMDDDLGRLLDRLAEPVLGHPVLILCTSWKVNDPTSPFETWRERGIERGSILAIHVGDLDEIARASLIDAVVPGTSTEVKRALIQKWRNPLCLELFLSWDKVQQRIVPSEDGPELRMTVQQIHVEPSTIPELYQARWDALNPSVKAALLTAAGCLPAGEPMHAFEASVIAEVVAANPSLVDWAVEGAAEEFLARLSAARRANWTLESGTAETFREVDIAEVVVRDATKTFEYEGLQQAIATVLASKVDELRDGGYSIDATRPECASTVRWLASLNPGGEQFALALTVARLSLARVEAGAWQFERALNIIGGDAALSVFDSAHRDAFAARLDLATWVGEAGNVELARLRCESLLADSGEGLSVDDPIVLVTRRWLSHYTGLCGSKDLARSMFSDLVVDNERLSGPEAITLNARGNAALWRGDAGDPDGAVEELTALIPLCWEFFGEDNHETLEVRRLRARFTGEGMNPEGARDQYRVLVADCLRMFTPTDFETLECRRGLARWTMEAGSPEEAIPMYRGVADDCDRIYGSAHFLTLWAWIGLGDALARMGDRAEARLWWEKALEVARRNWSPSHRLVTTPADRIAALA